MHDLGTMTPRSKLFKAIKKRLEAMGYRVIRPRHDGSNLKRYRAATRVITTFTYDSDAWSEGS